MSDAVPPRHGEGDHAQHGGGGSPPGAALVGSPLHHSAGAERSPSPFRGGSAALGYAIAVAWFLLDQLSKWAVLRPLALPDRASIELLPVFRLIWVGNRGVSLGLLTVGGELGRWLLTIATAGIALWVAAWLWRERRPWDAAALGLILGGALGNILDRVRQGYVTDFLNLHFGAWSPFLVFNVADVGVSLGVAFLVLRALLTRDAAPFGET